MCVKTVLSIYLKYWLITSHCLAYLCTLYSCHRLAYLCTLYSCPRVPYKVQNFRSTPHLSTSVGNAHMQANSALVSWLNSCATSLSTAPSQLASLRCCSRALWAIRCSGISVGFGDYAFWASVTCRSDCFSKWVGPNVLSVDPIPARRSRRVDSEVLWLTLHGLYFYPV